MIVFPYSFSVSFSSSAVDIAFASAESFVLSFFRFPFSAVAFALSAAVSFVPSFFRFLLFCYACLFRSLLSSLKTSSE